MSYSLNEVEAMAKKATRGAGYSWGLAEEASKATRWLCVQGLDGCGALAETLRQFEGIPLSDRSPTIMGKEWQNTRGTLCPLTAGTALSDHAHVFADRVVIADEIAAPALLLPFVAHIAVHCESLITVEWSSASVVTDGTQLCLDGLMSAASGGPIRILRGGTMGNPYTTSTRAKPNPADWETLNVFAHRTYAPATEESRLRGAGSTEGF